MKYYYINLYDCMVGGSFEKFLIFFNICVFDVIIINVYNWFVEVFYWMVMVGLFNDK